MKFFTKIHIYILWFLLCGVIFISFLGINTPVSVIAQKFIQPQIPPSIQLNNWQGSLINGQVTLVTNFFTAKLAWHVCSISILKPLSLCITIKNKHMRVVGATTIFTLFSRSQWTIYNLRGSVTGNFTKPILYKLVKLDIEGKLVMNMKNITLARLNNKIIIQSWHGTGQVNNVKVSGINLGNYKAIFVTHAPEKKKKLVKINLTGGNNNISTNATIIVQNNLYKLDGDVKTQDLLISMALSAIAVSKKNGYFKIQRSGYWY